MCYENFKKLVIGVTIMEEKLNREYFDPQAATFNYNVTGGGDSASGGSGGSGMECLQLRSQPGPFHYLISEQAKSLVALQELQNEVGALLEFRDLVIETFPNLRSKMAPSTPASGARRDWEPGVRVRRKLAGAGQDNARAKPQPSVQDSGFSTETSCGKDAHSSASATASATRSRPLEDELWALLDVIQRKGGRLRDEAELLRGELDERADAADTAHTAEEEFARALSASPSACGACGSCGDVQRLRHERDQLLARAAQLEAAALAAGAASAGGAASPARTPLGRLDAALDTPARIPRVPTPDSRKFAAILLESNPVELQRQLLTSTVQNQVLSERMKRVLTQRSLLLEKLDRARDVNEDLKFRLEEKSIELEGARARVRQLENARADERRDAHSSMRDMEPLPLPDERLERSERHERAERHERSERHERCERLDRSHRSAASERNDDDDDARIGETPRRGRPSRIPLHTAHKGAAPRPPAAPAPPAPPRPPSAHSAHSSRSARSSASARSRAGEARRGREAPAADPKTTEQASEDQSSEWERYRSSSLAAAAEYVSRVSRLAPLVLAPLVPAPLVPAVRARPAAAPRAYSPPPLPLAAELARSLLYDNSLDDSPQPDSLWNGKPQQYFESINCADDDYDSDSLAP